jgi:hypothetical protein
MAETRNSIANMALSHIGISDRIADISDRNTRARACLLFYDNVREQVLRDFDWPFARRVATLALVETFATDGSRDWLYSYRVPADSIAVRRILNGLSVRQETELTRVPFTVYGDDAGGLLYTDHATTPAVVAYTKNETEIGRFPPDCAQAMALLLAAHIAPEISRGDELKLGERALAKYDWRIRRAWANAANEEQHDPEVESSFVRSR